MNGDLAPLKLPPLPVSLPVRHVVLIDLGLKIFLDFGETGDG